MSSVRGCLLEQTAMPPRDYYDKRYFYFKDGVGHPTCGLARQILMPIYREWQLTTIGGDSWYWAVSSSNPPVRGYLAEQICLATIARKGLSAVTPDLEGAMKVEHFGNTPDWSTLIESGEIRRLYLPHSFHYPAIDGAILQLDRKENKAHLFLIQVTLANKHADSESRFYQDQWDRWTHGLNGFQAQSTFVWIDHLGSYENTIQQEEMGTRARTVLLNPSYTSVHVGVGEVDRRLFDVLNAKTD